jgi:hypothetical protein
MMRLRTFVKEHRVAVAIVAVAVTAFAVWMVIMVSGMGGQAVTAPPAVVSSAAGPRPTPSSGPVTPPASRGGTAGGDTAGSGNAASGTEPGGGVTPSGRMPTAQATGDTKGPVATAASNPTPPGTGRPDPFVPLASAAAPAAVTNPSSLPPVPPLSPTALGPLGGPAPGSGVPGGPALPPRAQFRLTGILFGPTAVAILNDGSASYVAEPGDPLARGVRLVAIDGANDSVTLALNNESWQLRLERGTSR